MKKTTLFLIIFITIIMIAGTYFCSSRSNPQDQIIKTEVLKAIAMLQGVYDQSQKEGLTLDQAKKIGADKLRALRYGADNQGYFWADTVEGLNIVLYGRKDTEGRNRYNDQLNGIYYIRELIKNGLKPGGGYTNYYFPKMGQKEPLPKRSYSILFKPFGWVVGTGYYLNNGK
jgi:methyl-accepting chemotaxis protein